LIGEPVSGGDDRAASLPRLAAARALLLFVASFIIVVPFPYHLLPNIGGYLSPWLEPLVRWIGDHILGITSPYTSAIMSDSTGMYILALLLLVVSIVAAILWSLPERRGKGRSAASLIALLRVAASYYLALQLFEYGLDKLFKHQFYLPEPNTLHTPLGALSRDILYWSTMGASHGYTVIAGLLEIVPAMLLLFRRTRYLGGLVATIVVAHVVMINLGFDISVKLYSLFLLLLSLIVAWPGIARLFDLFILNRPVDRFRDPPRSFPSLTIPIYAAARALVIVAILFEGLYPYFASGRFDDDSAPRPFLHGAYDVESFVGGGALSRLTRGGSGIRRFFVHRRGYFITESASDEMRDYRLEYDVAHRRLLLDAHSDSAIVLDYTLSGNDSTLTLSGRVEGDSVAIRARRIDLDALPLLRPSFHWTIDGYR
jgi:hypothetical protein